MDNMSQDKFWQKMKVIIEKSLELIILLRLLEQGMIIVIRATTFGYEKGGP